MSVDHKCPPQLTDDISYQDWKRDVTIWQLFTALEKKKQGPALYLSLQGKAKVCVRDLKPEDIGKEGGFKLILDKLDKAIEEDINYQTFSAFKTFYQFRRPGDMGMTEFIIKYESLYHQLEEFDMKLPEGVQAFFVLTAANISEENERLARVTCPELKYAEMKETLLRIFADPGATGGSEQVPAVKVEPIYKVSHRGNSYRGNSYRGNSYRGNYRGRGRGSYKSESGLNPTDHEGKIMVCFKCGSNKHFARECDNSGPEETEKNTEKSKKKGKPVYITLMNKPPDTKMSGFLMESLSMAVLDTGCSRTVVGEDWLREYKETLSDEELNMIESFPSQTSFVFGDGIKVTAKRSVKFPVTIGSQFVKISADVVSNQIPLLLSRQSM